MSGLDPICRREFLRRSFVLSAVAAGGSFVAACTPGSQDQDNVFAAGQWRTVNAVAEAVIPSGGAFEAGALDAGVPQILAKMLHAEEAHVASQVAAALTLLEYISVPLFGGRFSHLALEERTTAIDELMASRWELLRRLGRGLSRAITYAFYTTEAAWADIGYDGPLVEMGGGR